MRAGIGDTGSKISASAETEALRVSVYVCRGVCVCVSEIEPNVGRSPARGALTAWLN